MKRNQLCLALTLSALTFSPMLAEASIELSFFRVTPANAPQDVASQFTVSVLTPTEAESTYVGSDGVTAIDVTNDHGVFFAFTNTAVIPSSISEVYFDDGTIIEAPTIYNSINLATNPASTSSSTQYTAGANPGNLPGGNNVSPPFVATATFSVDAVGNPSRGVDTADDILGLSFKLQGTQDFDDLLDSLENGDLRVGFHVRSIGDDGDSDSFVNNPPIMVPPGGGIDPPTPEPGSLVVWSAMMTAVGFVSSRCRAA